MQVKSLDTIKSLLEPDEEFLWHAKVRPRNPGQFPMLMIPIALIIVATTPDWGLKILFGVTAFFLIKWLSDLEDDADTMLFTNKRLLHVNNRFKLKGSIRLNR